VAGSQEVVLTTSGGLGEAETAGVILNVIPRDGGNTFSGTFFMSGANGSMQGSNYTQELKDAGLRSPQELRKVLEFNPMGGGRIVRDKLWFYLTYREVVAENTVPGMFFNRNAGDPTKWLVDFDTSRPAFVDSVTRNAVARLRLHWIAALAPERRRICLEIRRRGVRAQRSRRVCVVARAKVRLAERKALAPERRPREEEALRTRVAIAEWVGDATLPITIGEGEPALLAAVVGGAVLDPARWA